MVFAYFLKQVF